MITIYRIKETTYYDDYKRDYDDMSETITECVGYKDYALELNWIAKLRYTDTVSNGEGYYKHSESQYLQDILKHVKNFENVYQVGEDDHLFMQFLFFKKFNKYDDLEHMDEKKRNKKMKKLKKIAQLPTEEFEKLKDNTCYLGDIVYEAESFLKSDVNCNGEFISKRYTVEFDEYDRFDSKLIDDVKRVIRESKILDGSAQSSFFNELNELLIPNR